MFWNLENFFDYTDGGNGESDKEFSSHGHRHWTKTRFQTKCDAIAKSIFQTGEMVGRLPDLIGLCEVENRNALDKLLSITLLRKYDYAVIHRDSDDRRGIDAALLYRKTSFIPASVSFKVPVLNGERLHTRDILHTRMTDKENGTTIDFIVNHHPSKYGGDKSSDIRRRAAMEALKDLCDSLASVPPPFHQADRNPSVIVMGDFNDSPDGPQFAILDSMLINKAIPLHKKGLGTIRFEGRWNLIDMFLVSRDISDVTYMEICRIPFLMTYDRKHPGERPLRTYSGPRYTGGVSDHCPIILKWQ